MAALNSAKKEKIIAASITIQSINTIESDSLGFGAKCLVSACLPYREPKSSQLKNGCWQRSNGSYSLWIQGGPNGLPYGSYPRLFAIFLASEAKKTKSRVINLGANFTSFCRRINIDPSRGKKGAGKRLIEQIDRFCESRIGFIRNEANATYKERLELADKHSFFWESQASDNHLKKGLIHLSEAFYQEITQHVIPVDMRAVAVLKQSALALDIYQWLAYRMHSLQKSKLKSARPTWTQLNEQFGSNYTSIKHFKAEFINKLREVLAIYPQAKVHILDEGLLLLCSPTPVH